MTSTPIIDEKAAMSALKRVARIDGAIASLEGTRKALIAKINAASDPKLVKLINEREQLCATLEPWWAANAAALTNGERKSIELGGCMIGTALGTPSLVYGPGDRDFGLSKLKAAKWAKKLVRVTFAVDKVEVRKELDGARADDLKDMGYEVRQTETFFVRALEVPAVKP